MISIIQIAFRFDKEVIQSSTSGVLVSPESPVGQPWPKLNRNGKQLLNHSFHNLQFYWRSRHYKRNWYCIDLHGNWRTASLHSWVPEESKPADECLRRSEGLAGVKHEEQHEEQKKLKHFVAGVTSIQDTGKQQKGLVSILVSKYIFPWLKPLPTPPGKH